MGGGFAQLTHTCEPPRPNTSELDHLTARICWQKTGWVGFKPSTFCSSNLVPRAIWCEDSRCSGLTITRSPMLQQCKESPPPRHTGKVLRMGDPRGESWLLKVKFKCLQGDQTHWGTKYNLSESYLWAFFSLLLWKRQAWIIIDNIDHHYCHLHHLQFGLIHNLSPTYHTPLLRIFSINPLLTFSLSRLLLSTGIASESAKWETYEIRPTLFKTSWSNWHWLYGNQINGQPISQATDQLPNQPPKHPTSPTIQAIQPHQPLPLLMRQGDHSSSTHGSKRSNCEAFKRKTPKPRGQVSGRIEIWRQIYNLVPRLN